MLKLGNDAVVLNFVPLLLLIGILAVEVLIIIAIVKKIKNKKS